MKVVELPSKSDVAIAYKALGLTPDLSVNSRRVASALLDHFNRKSGRCDPSIARLAKLLRINRATVIRATAILTSTEVGLFSKQTHGGRHNCSSYQPKWRRFREIVREWDNAMKGQSKLQNSTDDCLSENVADRCAQGLQLERDSGRSRATQTNSKNQSKNQSARIERLHATGLATEELSGSPKTMAVPISKSHSAHHVRNSKKCNHLEPSRKEVARNAAGERLDRDMRELGPDIYVKLVSCISVDRINEALEHEMKQRGSGLRNILSSDEPKG